MTEAVSLKPDLGRFGVWLATRSITPSLAAGIEARLHRFDHNDGIVDDRTDCQHQREERQQPQQASHRRSLPSLKLLIADRLSLRLGKSMLISAAESCLSDR